VVKVTITSKPGVPYQHELTARSHTIIADVASDLNGGDTGATPHEIFLWSIGTCGAMTMQMFAEKSKIPVTSVTCEVTESVISDPDDATKLIPHIVESYEVEGVGLTQAHLDSLARVAKKCPVAKLVMGKKVLDATVALAAVGTPPPRAGTTAGTP
jgi:putative redox protein